MPKLSGAFQIFKDLDTLDTQSIYRWLDTHIQPQVLENHFANRLLYPQTIPVTAVEAEIDLAILREAIRLNSAIFYNNSLKTVTIPEGFLERFQPTDRLIAAFIDGLNLTQNSQLVIKRSDGGTLKGTILFPFTQSNPPHQLIFTTIKNEKLISNQHPNQQLSVPNNQVIILPQTANQQIELTVDKQNPIMLNLGNLGLVIDFRGATT